MTASGPFAVGVLVIVAVVVLLTRRTQRVLEPLPSGGARVGERTVSAGDLYLNVVVSQAVIGGVLLGLAWWTDLPAGALGIVDGDVGSTVAIVGGAVLGVGLFLLNAGSVRVLDRLGIGYSEALRGALSPATTAGWGALLCVVLPLIAAVEELVFRAALIGGLDVGTGIPLVVLVLGSSAAFALGHGMQGPGGVLVTGGLGIALAGAFVLSGSLLLVIVAHYVVNALEFVGHEGIR